MVEKSEAKLCQSIGPWQVLFYGLGSMLGAGVYVLLGRAAGLLGNAVWLAFLVAMVAALLTGLSYASVGSRLHGALSSADRSMHTAPLLAGGIISAGLLMHWLIRPRPKVAAVRESPRG